MAMSTSESQLSVPEPVAIPRASVLRSASQFSSRLTAMSAGQVMLASGAMLSSTMMSWSQDVLDSLPQSSSAVAVHVRVNS